MHEETTTFIKEQIEVLAGMVKSDFDEVERSIDQLRRETTDNLNNVESRLRNLDNRLDTFVTHDRRITRLEKKVGLPTADLL